MLFDDIRKKLPYKARRESSYDRTGGNEDSIVVPSGGSLTLCDVHSSGEIRHIWLTIGSDDEYYLRKVLIRMYWDGESEPSVNVPVGDFFCLGHSVSYSLNIFGFTASINNENRQGEGVALNCWLPMPFSSSARIEILNEQEDHPVRVYYYVDWREYTEGSSETVYTFHASWRRENPAGNEGGCDADKGINLTDRNNYKVLYAEGEGNYIGMNYSVDNLEGEWWGEGDDMFFIDRPDSSPECGGEWPPDLHGTGSEDYFCNAWGMQHQQGLYAGQAWCEDKWFERAHNCNGKVVCYRFHFADPVPFTRNIRFSIEHGHANDRSDDIASTAYWYQTEPHSPKSFEPLPPADKRLPRPAKKGRKIATYM